jgi:hypothetical protein
MSLKAPLRREVQVTALLSVLSYFVRPMEATLATTCYVDFNSDVLIGDLDFACGVVNDTSVGGSCREIS